MQVILGMGCDRNVSLATLESAIDQALESIQLKREAIAGVATIDKKDDETALLALARRNNWPMTFYTASDLAAVEVPNPSEVVMKYMGTPAVSEAAAILAARTNMHNLLLEKFKFCGTDGKNATVSIVRMNNE